VASVLLVAERSHRLTKADSSMLIDLLGSLLITIDEETADRAMGPILSRAREMSLSAYDAAYLELAMGRGLRLATRDRALRSACRKAGVALFA